MTKRAAGKSAEFYQRGLKLLREYARGFDASNGFKLNKKLTPAQKKKITQGVKEIDSLTAQQRYIYKPKNNSKKETEKLRAIQRVTQTDEGKLNLKVAFVPHTPRITKKGKQSKPRITVTKSGGVRIQENKYAKIFVPLIPSKLAANPEKEIQRAVKENAKGATRFSVQAGANEIPVYRDLPGIVKYIRQLMNTYDGKRQLPASSGNRGDAPKAHHWKKWLHGAVAYWFPEANADDVRKAVNDFFQGNQELQKKRRAERARQNYKRKKRR